MALCRIALLGLSLLIWAAATPGLRAQEVAKGQELVTLSGRETMHDLTLNTQVATSVTFPSDITLVTGYGLVLDAARAQELVDAETMAVATLKDLAPKPVTIIHYAQAAHDTLVMRAIRPGTPCYVSVRCGTKIYLFKCSAGDNANVAVIMADKVEGDGTAVEVKKADVLKDRIAFGSTELLAILSRAKQREFLETVNPDLFEGWQQRRDLSLASAEGEVHPVITEIQSWPQKDALVFRCRVENKGKEVFRFKPSDARIRVGDAVYGVQLADSSGVVQPGKATLLDVVLQGNAGGGREHLSIQNDFRLEVAADNSPPPPNDLLPPPNPLQPAMPGPRGMLLPLPESSPPAPPEPSSSGKEYHHPLPNLYPGK
jgi:hypothetical protein